MVGEPVTLGLVRSQSAPQSEANGQRSSRTGGGALGTLTMLVIGYMGVYLCRKNFATAIPLLQTEFGASRSQIGRIVSVSTIAYALGKLLLGPLVDRIGGRLGFVLSIFAVALFGALSALSPGLSILMVLYSLNRFVGAGAWPAMMKLTPSWTPKKRSGAIIALMSLSYVLGGVAASLVSRQVLVFAEHAHFTTSMSWRAVLGVPAAITLAIAILSALIVRRGPLRSAAEVVQVKTNAVARLVANPRFLIVCGLSFAVTLLREAFNTWSVDFLSSLQHGEKSLIAAALGSTTFDLFGAVSILFFGLVWDRIPVRAHRFLIAGVLGALALLVLCLSQIAESGAVNAAWLLGAVGFLIHGPYSLCGGVIAIEIGGEQLAASASGIIDGVGYIAAIFAGEILGGILDRGGYPLGFKWLSAIVAVAAVLALWLRPSTATNH